MSSVQLVNRAKNMIGVLEKVIRHNHIVVEHSETHLSGKQSTNVTNTVGASCAIYRLSFPMNLALICDIPSAKPLLNAHRKRKCGQFCVLIRIFLQLLQELFHPRTFDVLLHR